MWVALTESGALQRTLLLLRRSKLASSPAQPLLSWRCYQAFQMPGLLIVEGRIAAGLMLVGAQPLVEVQITSWPRHLSNAGSRASLLVTRGPHVGGSTAQQ